MIDIIHKSPAHAYVLIRPVWHKILLAGYQKTRNPCQVGSFFISTAQAVHKQEAIPSCARFLGEWQLTVTNPELDPLPQYNFMWSARPVRGREYNSSYAPQHARTCLLYNKVRRGNEVAARGGGILFCTRCHGTCSRSVELSVTI